MNISKFFSSEQLFVCAVVKLWWNSTSEYNKNNFIIVAILWTGATDCTFIVSETYNDDRIITNCTKLKRMALDVLSA